MPTDIRKAKSEVVRKLADDWQSLADALDISPADRATFRSGSESRDIWEWLERRGRLDELPGAFSAIGRDDLVAALGVNRLNDKVMNDEVPRETLDAIASLSSDPATMEALRRVNLVDFSESDLQLLKLVRKNFAHDGGVNIADIAANLGMSFSGVAEKLGRVLMRLRSVEPQPAQPALGVIVDPGDATPEEVAELFVELSMLYRMLGGSGISFSITDVKEPAVA